MKDSIFKLIAIIWFPEFAEFTEFSLNLGKTLLSFPYIRLIYTHLHFLPVLVIHKHHDNYV